MPQGSPDAAFAAEADALYAVPTAAFTAERTARAKAARGTGDRDLAARIAALPKPSAAAGLVNRLVRDGDDLQRVLDLGSELRRAQADGDRDRLRQLAAARRELLEEVTRRAAEGAAADGRPAGPMVLEELQQTLQAALADEDAASAVRTGRLVRALRADGLDPVDAAGAVGGPGGAPAERPSARPRGVPEPADDADARQREAGRREAEQRAADARSRATDAVRRADEAAGRARDAADLLERRTRAVQDLLARADELRRAQQEAETEAGAASSAASAADADAAGTAAAAARARAEADAADADLRRLAAG